LTKNAGTIKYGTFNNAASNTGVVAVSAIFTGTAVNSGVIGNILPINTANLVASNSAAWDSTYYTVSALSAEWNAGGGGGGAADLTAISDVSATWDAAFTFVSLNSSILVDTYDSRLSDARTPDVHTHDISAVTGLQSALDAKQATGDYATLVGGKIPSTQLPSYVDDVLEYNAVADLPATGATGIIYVATSTNKTYRWSGSAYVEISPSPGSTDAVTEGATNLYFTNQRAQDALSSSLAGKADASHSHTIDDVSGLSATIDALQASIDAAGAAGDFAAADDERLVLVGTNSASWNSVYASVQGSSATWNAGGGGSGGSAEGIAAYTAVTTNSATWNTQNNHVHPISAVTNLQANINSLSSAIDGKQASGSYASATDARITLVGNTSANWNNSYTTLTANSARWTSSYSTLTATSATWSAKANASHTHAIADVTNLQTSLDAKASSTDARIVLVGTTSAKWNSSYNTLTATSATWSAKADASHTHTTSDITNFNTATDARIAAAAGVSIASLVGGTIPSAQLPSYVDDVLEYASTATFPATGSAGIIYVATGTNKTYRWSGSAYVEIASSPGSTDSVTEGSVNLYFTNARATAALQTTVNSLSSAIDGKQASGSYAAATDARITLVGTNSASWSSSYTVVNSNSAAWSAAGSSTPSFSSLTTGGVTLLSAMLSTFATPVTASGDFIVVTVGTKKRLIRLWDNT
jgi:hypothetical protein